MAISAIGEKRPQKAKIVFVVRTGEQGDEKGSFRFRLADLERETRSALFRANGESRIASKNKRGEIRGSHGSGFEVHAGNDTHRADKCKEKIQQSERFFEVAGVA